MKWLAIVLLGSSPGLLAAIPTADIHTDQVHITFVGPEPPAGSGIIHFVVEIRGTAGGAEQTYFQTFLRKGQDTPQVGQDCSIAWHWWEHGRQVDNGLQREQGRLIDSFVCHDPAISPSAQPS